MASAPFVVRLQVRSYELDSLGHVNQAVYHQYAEHGRMEMIAAAGFDGGAIPGVRVGPVLLESTLRYRSELRVQQEFAVATTAEFGDRKVFSMHAELTKSDGTVAASMSGVFGFMDLDARKLLPSALDTARRCCTDPTVLVGAD